MPTAGVVAAIVGAVTAAASGVDQHKAASRGEKRAGQAREAATSALVSEKRAADTAQAEAERDAPDIVAIEEDAKSKKTNKQRTTLGGNVDAYGTDPSASSLGSNPNLGTPA